MHPPQYSRAENYIVLPMRSETSDIHYDVKIRHKVWSCTCPHFIGNLRGVGECKHIFQVRLKIALQLLGEYEKHPTVIGRWDSEWLADDVEDTSSGGKEKESPSTTNRRKLMSCISSALKITKSS